MDDGLRKDLQEAARDDLLRYQQARRDIEHLRDKIMRQRQKAMGVGGRKPPAVRVQQQANIRRTEELLCLIDELQQAYGAKMIEAESICMDIEKRISCWTTGLHSRILRSIYLFNLSVKDVAAAESYSVSQIKRYHWAALVVYGQRLKEDEPR